MLFVFPVGVSCLSLRVRLFDFIMLSVSVCVCVLHWNLDCWLVVTVPVQAKPNYLAAAPVRPVRLVYVTSVCSSASGQAEVQLNCWTRLKEATKTGCFCIKSSCFLPPKYVSINCISFQLQPVFVTSVLDFFLSFFFV